MSETEPVAVEKSINGIPLRGVLKCQECGSPADAVATHCLPCLLTRIRIVQAKLAQLTFMIATLDEME